MHSTFLRFFNSKHDVKLVPRFPSLHFQSCIFRSCIFSRPFLNIEETVKESTRLSSCASSTSVYTVCRADHIELYTDMSLALQLLYCLAREQRFRESIAGARY